MRYFRAELTDADGETHSYAFECLTLWAVSLYIVDMMRIEGDFYGHTGDQTVKLEVNELVSAPLGAINRVWS